MAEDTTNDATETDAEGTSATDTDKGTAKPDIPVEVKRALNKANKEAEGLRLKLKEYEDRDKSESEKLADARAAAEKRAEDAELRATRLEVAADKGLTPAQAKRLVGSTRDELAADADEILRDFPAAAATTATTKTPKADPSQGSRGSTKTLSGRDAGLAEAQKRFGVKSTT